MFPQFVDNCRWLKPKWTRTDKITLTAVKNCFLTQSFQFRLLASVTMLWHLDSCYGLWFQTRLPGTGNSNFPLIRHFFLLLLVIGFLIVVQNNVYEKSGCIQFHQNKTFMIFRGLTPRDFYIMVSWIQHWRIRPSMCSQRQLVTKTMFFHLHEKKDINWSAKQSKMTTYSTDFGAFFKFNWIQQSASPVNVLHCLPLLLFSSLSWSSFFLFIIPIPTKRSFSTCTELNLNNMKEKRRRVVIVMFVWPKSADAATMNDGK